MVFVSQKLFDAFARKQVVHAKAVMGYYKNLALNLQPKFKAKFGEDKTKMFEYAEKIVSQHDRDKFVNDEITSLFALRYFSQIDGKHMEEARKAFSGIDLESKIIRAVEAHRESQLHHYEFYKDPSSITACSLLEMIADWAAVSEEIGSNAVEWYNHQVAVGSMYFSPEINDIILESLEYIEPFIVSSRELQRFGNNPVVPNEQ